MEDLAQQFHDAFDDKQFTRKEVQQLRAIMKQEKLEPRELAVLRARLFDIAREEMATTAPALVLDWLERANKLVLPVVQPPPDNEVYFSPGTECKAAILRLLGNAKQRLDICVFTISDDQISNAIETAHRSGIKVRIITDNDKSRDKGSDIYSLKRKGLNIKVDASSKHMHHKFAIADGTTLLTGSYNWTRSAATRNEENVLVTEDSMTVRAYQKEFDKLWKEMKQF